MPSENIRFYLTPTHFGFTTEFADYQGTTASELGTMYLTEAIPELDRLDIANVATYLKPAHELFGRPKRGERKTRPLICPVTPEVKVVYLQNTVRTGFDVPYLGRISFLRGLALNMIDERYTPEI